MHPAGSYSHGVNNSFGICINTWHIKLLGRAQQGMAMGVCSLQTPKVWLFLIVRVLEAPAAIRETSFCSTDMLIVCTSRQAAQPCNGHSNGGETPIATHYCLAGRCILEEYVCKSAVPDSIQQQQSW